MSPKTRVQSPFSAGFDLRGRLQGAKQKIADAWRDMARRLVEKGLLTPLARARLEPRIRVTVKDRREDPSPPLPSLED